MVEGGEHQDGVHRLRRDGDGLSVGGHVLFLAVPYDCRHSYPSLSGLIVVAEGKDAVGACHLDAPVRITADALELGYAHALVLVCDNPHVAGLPLVNLYLLVGENPECSVGIRGDAVDGVAVVRTCRLVKHQGFLLRVIPPHLSLPSSYPYRTVGSGADVLALIAFDYLRDLALLRAICQCGVCGDEVYAAIT